MYSRTGRFVSIRICILTQALIINVLIKSAPLFSSQTFHVELMKYQFHIYDFEWFNFVNTMYFLFRLIYASQEK